MKKQCTPSNNGMSIKSSIACATTVITTPVCISPVSYLLNEASNMAYVNGTAISDEIGNLLDSGIYITDTEKFCCPNCNDIYFLGFFEIFTNSLTSLLSSMTCCYNYVGTANTLNQYPQIGSLPCCKTSFSDCVSTINENINGGHLTFFGNVFEYNTINNESSLCLLYDALNNSLDGDISSLLEKILSKGIVVKCIDCKIFIGSAATYYNLFID